MLPTLTKLFHLLSEIDRKNALKLLFFLAFMGLFEMMGIASILPFLAVVGSPEIITENQSLHSIYLFADLYFFNMNENSFLILLGMFSFVFILITAILRIYSIYVMNKYIETTRHHLSLKLLSRYVYQSYEYFTNRHSSELTKNIMSEIDFVVINAFRPIIQMISYIFVLIAIISLLLWHDPIMATTVILVMGSLYGAMYFLSRGRILKYGDLVVRSNKKRFKTASDALNGIKNIKMYNCEEVYLKEYKLFSLNFVQSAYRFQTLNQAPKHLLEALAFGGIIVLVIAILYSTPDSKVTMGEVLPVLALYAISAYRIQPALSAVYQGMTSLTYGGNAINNLFNEFKSTKIKRTLSTEIDNRIIPKKTICLNGISHKFKTSENIIKELSLTIKVGSCVGIMGGSGAGKTTLLDLILGLNSPTEGFISVDDQEINSDNITSWKRCLGYVPQVIFILDSSFAENIAFGVPLDEIDYEKVVECAKSAQIHNFIISNDSKGYDAKVGERGSRISGGQNQRIGVARALYTNPDILILDEATSALDLATEEMVLKSVLRAMRHKTIIMVTHKLDTVKNCDSIVFLENGKIKYSGLFDEFKNSNIYTNS